MIELYLGNDTVLFKTAQIKFRNSQFHNYDKHKTSDTGSGNNFSRISNIVVNLFLQSASHRANRILTVENRRVRPKSSVTFGPGLNAGTRACIDRPTSARLGFSRGLSVGYFTCVIADKHRQAVLPSLTNSYILKSDSKDQKT